MAYRKAAIQLSIHKRGFAAVADANSSRWFRGWAASIKPASLGKSSTDAGHVFRAQWH